MPRLSDDLEAEFKRLAEHPDSWRDSAKTLKHAAELVGEAYAGAFAEMRRGAGLQEVVERLTYGPPFLLLAGLAIENLAKALDISRREPKSIGGKLPSGIARHDSLKLLTECRVPLTPAEKKFIRRLENFVSWISRYPVPKKASAMRRLSASGADLASFRALFEKLDKECSRCIAEFDARKEGY
jgi:hypothetical protein